MYKVDLKIKVEIEGYYLWLTTFFVITIFNLLM